MEQLKNNAVKALMDMPHNMQYSYAFGVLGGAMGMYKEHELKSLYSCLNEAINQSRL